MKNNESRGKWSTSSREYVYDIVSTRADCREGWSYHQIKWDILHRALATNLLLDFRAYISNRFPFRNLISISDNSFSTFDQLANRRVTWNRFALIVRTRIDFIVHPCAVYRNTHIHIYRSKQLFFSKISVASCNNPLIFRKSRNSLSAIENIRQMYENFYGRRMIWCLWEVKRCLITKVYFRFDSRIEKYCDNRHNAKYREILRETSVQLDFHRCQIAQKELFPRRWEAIWENRDT